ncbi:MAG: PP2C family serine/threonine-protein phosphatase [Terracidiphilus sp.]
MSTASVRYAVAAVSDLGSRRASNEDACGYSVECGVYVVCDGMGGAAAGEIASSVAIDEILRQLCNRAEGGPLEEIIQQAIRAANQAIYSRAQNDPQLSGMGTTLVGLVTEGSRVLVFNVGDSRCYRLRVPGPRQGISALAPPDLTAPDPSSPDQAPAEQIRPQARPEQAILEQITLDHSLVEEQVRLGNMTPAEALRSPLRNVITRALGTQAEVPPDLFELEAEPGDLFLLCSDGLTRELADPVLESMLAADLTLEEHCARLVQAANLAGGHDNITCLLVRAEA